MSTAGVLAGSAGAAAIFVAASRSRPRILRKLPRAMAVDDGPNERPRHRRRLALAVAVVAAAVVAVLEPGLAAFGGLGATAVVVVRRRKAAHASRQAIDAAMPDAIELMVMCLHAGLTPTQAVGELARLAPPSVRAGFAATEQRLHRGTGFADALVELSGHCGRSALALVSALGTAVRDGLPLAPVLDRLTDEANAGRRRAGEAEARRLPVRLSFPLVVCTLPSFVLLAIAPAVLGALSTVRGSAL
jgi:Flp pilus assembly protein TadB